MADPTRKVAGSPFPGMVPYLEMHWSDVQARMSTYISNQLQPLLPRGLVARIEQYVAVEEEGEFPDRFRPDAAMYEQPGIAHPYGETHGVTTVEPVLVERYVEPAAVRYVKIVETSGTGRFVTSLEVVSPSNKMSVHGADLFCEKQEVLHAAGVNLVEIDLLRGGRWVISAPQQTAPRKCRRPYRICVVRANKQKVAEMYPASFKARLPIIRVPLRESDVDVPLDIQKLVDQTYHDGNYYVTDHEMEPYPPMRGDDARWVDDLLKSKGKGSADAE